MEKSSNFKKAFLMWALLALFSFFQFFMQASGNLMGQAWKIDFNLSELSLSLLSASFFYAYVIVQVLAGFLYDYWGPKRVVRLSVFAFSIGLLIFASSHSFYLALLARFLIGLAAGFAFVGMVYVAASWFDMSLFILFVALGEMLSMFLTAVGQWFTAEWIMNYGWRPVIFGLAALGFILFVMVFWFLKNPPQFQPNRHHFLKSLKEEFCSAIRIPSIWLAGILCAGMFGVMTVFASLWGSFFLQQAYEISYLDATRMIALIPLGIACGGPLFSFFNERYFKTNQITITVGFLLFVTGIVLISFDNSITLLSLMLLLLGILGGCNVLAFYIVEQAVAVSIRGISVGLCNALAILFGTLFQSLIGLLFQNAGWFSQNKALAARWALSPFIGILFCAFLAAIFLSRITQKQKYL